MFEYKNCWITLNHACNLRCKWCYANETGYKVEDNMKLRLAFQIIDICKELSIKHITLIGGEPTIYPHLDEVFRYSQKLGIRCGMVTNGLLFAKSDFAEQMKNIGMRSVSISLKGYDRRSYIETTGVDCFEQVQDAISCCIQSNISPTVSMVLSEDNIDNFLSGVISMKNIGVRNFRFSFLYEFNHDCIHEMPTQNPVLLSQKFEAIYPELNSVTGGNFNLFCGLPLCIWNPAFIEMLSQHNQITTVCQLLKRSGLIFDPNGCLLPCNAMPTLSLGRLNEDFCNGEELCNFVKTARVTKVYDRLCGLPSKDCLPCRDMVNCGGGCVCQWTNYSFDSLREKMQ